MFGDPVEISTSFEYLGLIIDSKLSWSEHIKSKFATSTPSCGNVCTGMYLSMYGLFTTSKNTAAQGVAFTTGPGPSKQAHVNRAHPA